MDKPCLFIVIPCYKEQEMLPITAEALHRKVEGLVCRCLVSPNSRVLFVDDGSPDGTWEVIRGLSGDPRYSDLFCGISLAHNRGHQHALLAGLMEALDRGCDCAISMDADLQDDPAVIEKMLADYADGSEVVYGARSSRDRDTAFKRGTARLFYRLMGSLGVELVPDSADCRLMGRRSLEALSSYEEQNLFLRGLVPSIGFKSSTVYYERGERTAGESKYPLRKMISFAVEGVTSFSTAPIRMVAVAGLLFLLLSAAMLAWSVISAFAGSTVPGWSSLMVSLWFVGGALMLSIGVVGEYVGKCYMEAKHRPRWHVAERVG